jgi:hypothetical protein
MKVRNLDHTRTFPVLNLRMLLLLLFSKGEDRPNLK